LAREADHPRRRLAGRRREAQGVLGVGLRGTAANHDDDVDHDDIDDDVNHDDGATDDEHDGLDHDDGAADDEHDGLDDDDHVSQELPLRKTHTCPG
jgi:hypothetical protein